MIAAAHADRLAGVEDELLDAVERNRWIHEIESLNLDPASNVMNPRAEALLAAGLGSRPSLGVPGAKYETGLEAIEDIERLTSRLVSEVFGARHVEFRVASGAMANLYAFLATTSPGDTIIAPPASMGGHVTHHQAGAAGLAGLRILHAPVHTTLPMIDLDGLARLVEAERPVLITLGGSLNLSAHPVAAVREIADRVGARVLFDAAHLCGMIAGGVMASPLTEGAHLMTMSTYKSLGGPPSGLVLTDDDELAGRLDAIAHPGLTANFDVAKTAALAMTMLDWLACGSGYAEAMVATARALGDALGSAGLDVVRIGPDRCTDTHHVALDVRRFGGGQTLAARWRRANLLTCGIGLPGPEVPGDVPGLRLGTPEMVRWGMGPAEAETVAGFLVAALEGEPEPVGQQVTPWRRGYDTIHFVRGGPLRAFIPPLRDPRPTSCSPTR